MFDPVPKERKIKKYSYICPLSKGNNTFLSNRIIKGRIIKFNFFYKRL